MISDLLKNLPSEAVERSVCLLRCREGVLRREKFTNRIMAIISFVEWSIYYDYQLSEARKKFRGGIVTDKVRCCHGRPFLFLVITKFQKPCVTNRQTWKPAIIGQTTRYHWKWGYCSCPWQRHDFNVKMYSLRFCLSRLTQLKIVLITQWQVLGTAP